MPRDKALEVSLLVIRLSVAAFLLVWAVDKLIMPEHARAVFGKFYLLPDMSFVVLKGLGAVQIAVICAFAAGLARTWTYGAVLLMHAASTLSTYPHIIHPFAEGRQLLFWASVPVLAAMIALFILRERDQLVSLDELRAGT